VTTTGSDVPVNANLTIDNPNSGATHQCYVDGIKLTTANFTLSSGGEHDPESVASQPQKHQLPIEINALGIMLTSPNR